MSYCRIDEDSDVYVFGSTKLECYVRQNFGPSGLVTVPPLGSSMGWLKQYNDSMLVFDNRFTGKSYYTESRGEMARHLLLLMSNGVRVPKTAITRLITEITVKGDKYDG